MSWREKKEYAYAYPLDKASHRNAVVASLSRWVAEEQVPVVLAVVRCGGFAMVESVDPSVRRLRHPVASRLIPGCGAIAFLMKICHNTFDL